MSVAPLTSEAVLAACRVHYEEIVAIRRDIHQHPEIGFDVHRTAGIAASEMEKLGLVVRTEIGVTGVVGDLEIPGATKRIALRADMDALPLQEEGDPPYKSLVPGKAHMCGHDVHTAMLIGAARVLTEMRDSLSVNVRFIFQPSEEQFPGGAPAMMADGVLDGVDEIYGLHVWPMLAVGNFAICPGPALGQPDVFEINISGKGGHAAIPQHTVDPIVIASQYVSMLQSIVGRSVDPLASAVVSVTQFHGGTADNIIPGNVRLKGTVRTLDKAVQKTVRAQMETMLAGITAAHGATFNFAYEEGYPVTFNHASCVDYALHTIRDLVGREQVQFPVAPTLGGEDFGYYSQEIPACFVFMGMNNEAEGITRICHDPRFDVDENCIPYGMAMHASLALRFG